MPWRLTRVYVGRNPTALQYAAGVRPEPPVSSPTDAVHRCAARATPDPELDSPGVRSRSQGLRAMPHAGARVPPSASSLIESLPSRIVPALDSAVITDASCVGT